VSSGNTGSGGDALLTVRDLAVSFDSEDGVIHAVRGVSFEVARGNVLGIVGESGCGKSVSCHSILHLLPQNARVSGSIRFEGRDLTTLDAAGMDAVRGRDIAMIFQDPSASLNPVHTVGGQIAESLQLHRGMAKREALAEAMRLLDRVGIPEARQRLGEYPHQLSGGMNQRVMIAMALACRPKLLIADEPTTALDVTIQAQILDLLHELRAEYGMALILITHDLGVVAEIADTVVVMYAGDVAEERAAADLFARPAHPYSAGLLASVPRIDRTRATLVPIEGAVPSPLALPPGCAFAPRCTAAQPDCTVQRPLPRTFGSGRVTCLHPLGDAA
jgi:oligopeptide/dipeptide ABC transporter ATP-binding protein